MRLLPLIAAMAAALGAGAAESSRGSVYLTIDNDLVVGSDDGYTSGFQAGWVSHALDRFADGPLPAALGNALERLPLFSADGRQRIVAPAWRSACSRPRTSGAPTASTTTCPTPGCWC